MSPYKAILLFGAPGTGKGTQGALLAQVPGLHHVATGDLFRALDKQSDLGKEFTNYSSRGELVPDRLTVELFLQSLVQRALEGKFQRGRDILVLDGIPRTVEQAVALDPLVQVLGIIHLTCTDQEAMVHRMRQRALKQGRPDDADESVIRRRFEVYRLESQPVLHHYPTNRIRDVSALGSPAGVLAKIMEIVAPILDSNSVNPLA